MQTSTLLFIMLIVSQFAFAQFSLKMKGKAQEILSGESKKLQGVLAKPKISPHSTRIFSFVRQLEDNRYLYIYNVSTRQLTEVAPVRRSEELEITPEKSKSRSQVFNDQLEWRPVLGRSGRQWFVFISNGAANNHDLYLGRAEGGSYIRLTDDPAIDSYPAWSPDGKSIAFVSARTGNGDLYIIEDVDAVIESGDPAKAKLIQLTQTMNLEISPRWNPNLQSRLLAYAKREDYQGGKIKTFQIRVLNLNGDRTNPLKLTDQPSVDYSRPLWDPNDDSRLLYLGQSIEQKSPANLYISRVRWNENKELEATQLQGYNPEVFTEVRLNDTPVMLLTGSNAVLVQKDNQEQRYPLYSVNINRWEKGQRRATNYFEELHKAYPYISEYDMKDQALLFATQEGKFFKIFAAEIDGEDIVLLPTSNFVMKNPRGQGGSGVSKPLWIAAGGGALVAGGIIIYLITRPDEIETIGYPPDLTGVGKR